MPRLTVDGSPYLDPFSGATKALSASERLVRSPAVNPAARSFVAEAKAQHGCASAAFDPLLSRFAT